MFYGFSFYKILLSSFSEIEMIKTQNCWKGKYESFTFLIEFKIIIYINLCPHLVVAQWLVTAVRKKGH